MATLFACAASNVRFVSAQPALNRLEQQLEQSANDVPRPGDAVADAAGYLGIIADDRRDRGQGVRVVDVVSGGPADRAGMRIGDLITQINDKPIRSMEEFAGILSGSHPEQRVSFTIQRADRTQERVVTLGHRPSPAERKVPPFGGPPPAPPLANAPPPEAPKRRLLGVRSVPVTDEARQFFGVPEARGALVSEVVPGSPAERAGLPLDAIIVALDGTQVSDPNELARLVAAAGAGAEVELSYFSRGQLLKKKVILGQFEGAAATEPAAKNPAAAEPAAPRQPVQAAAGDDLKDRMLRLEQRLRRLEMILDRMMPPGAAGPGQLQGPPPGGET